MGFNGIIGHQNIITALESVLNSGKIGHAYLFAGPSGAGKDTIARLFAMRLLCKENKDECNCESCQKLKMDVHPDFHVITPAGSSIKIEQLRELQQKAYLSSVLGGKKVFYFPEAERLTDAAANSFLKILEESPSGVVFLFTAVRLDNLLGTIRSRCQIYNLFKVPLAEIEQGLIKRGFTVEEASRRVHLSQGLPGLALQTDDDRVETKREPVILEELLQLDLIQIFKLIDTMEKWDREDVLRQLREWEIQLRSSITEAADRNIRLRNLKIIDKMSQAIKMCEYNVNIRLLLDELLISIKLIEC
ncbi:MAG TPA: DNA polymerase III subunit delta' [Bacillota bacterium]|nr:DNA polymerase III subunit delta' [Bacillota bacterium]HOL08601.1 DNA polymerase III subunit delta' [Bacillota bacterium]HPO98416.1 DNA polymerase III subunit delta' [Bacillota bacterium]